MGPRAPPATGRPAGLDAKPLAGEELLEDLRYAVVVVAGDDVGGGGQDFRVRVGYRVGGAGPGEKGQGILLAAECDDLAAVDALLLPHQAHPPALPIPHPAPP